MKPTAEQLAKLPKWAQDHIHTITRERDASVRSLNEYCDDSTPSPFEVSEYVCTGEQQGPSLKRRYIQAHTIEVRWRGVKLRIGANDYGQSGKGIRLEWGAENERDACALIPDSYQSVRITSKKDMLEPENPSLKDSVEEFHEAVNVEARPVIDLIPTGELA